MLQSFVRPSVFCLRFQRYLSFLNSIFQEYVHRKSLNDYVVKSGEKFDRAIVYNGKLVSRELAGSTDP